MTGCGAAGCSHTRYSADAELHEWTGGATDVLQLFYSPAYVGSGYAFDTTRKARWVADSLAASPISGVALVAPAPLTREQAAEVHDPAYVQAVETGVPRSLAESQGFSWDGGLWPMVLASNGGVVAAAHAALEHGVAGSMSSGLHHAAYASGAGFCTFNGLALAARAALSAGARSVLILDLDAHCGGGTASLIAGEPRIHQLDLAVDRFDSYAATEQARLVFVTTSVDYLPTLRRVLNEMEHPPGALDLCLYNAGMDPCERCSIGGLDGITPAILAERERIVFEWCDALRLPIAFVFAGGYIGARLDAAELVALHRLTVSAASRAGLSRRRT
jgi:acetoin utilization deacetylase AcuC-like enzyme